MSGTESMDHAGDALPYLAPHPIRFDPATGEFTYTRLDPELLDTAMRMASRLEFLSREFERRWFERAEMRGLL